MVWLKMSCSFIFRKLQDKMSSLLSAFLFPLPIPPLFVHILVPVVVQIIIYSFVPFFLTLVHVQKFQWLLICAFKISSFT